MSLQQDSEVAGADGVPAGVGSPIGVHRAGQVALFLEQHSEIARGSGVAALIGPSERVLGGGPILLVPQGVDVDHWVT